MQAGGLSVVGGDPRAGRAELRLEFDDVSDTVLVIHCQADRLRAHRHWPQSQSPTVAGPGSSLSLTALAPAVSHWQSRVMITRARTPDFCPALRGVFGCVFTTGNSLLGTRSSTISVNVLHDQRGSA